MKLADYVRAKGLPHNLDHCRFDNVRAFAFGADYAIVIGPPVDPVLLNNATGNAEFILFDNLDDILDIMHTEYSSAFATCDAVPHTALVSADRLRRRGYVTQSGAVLGPTSLRAQDQAAAMATDATSDGISPRGRVEDRVLCVTAGTASPIFPFGGMDAYCDMIREQVTQYVISQSWDLYLGAQNL